MTGKKYKKIDKKMVKISTKMMKKCEKNCQKNSRKLHTPSRQLDLLTPEDLEDMNEGGQILQCWDEKMA